VLGIDLGTTNSTAAEVTWSAGQASPPQARCIEIDQNTLEGTYTHTLVPSAIALYNGNEWIGEGAKRLRARGPQFELERNRDLFYECKNDIGLRRTYSEAPEGFRNASEIAARVLAYIVKTCAGDTAFDRVVVTVPASFQLAQRQDTRDAAKRAGIDMRPGDLFDEPVAAFLDYLVANRASLAGTLETPKTLVVFDFGGGTCDVAVLRLGAGHQVTGRINISPAAVSRYRGTLARQIINRATGKQCKKWIQIFHYRLEGCAEGIERRDLAGNGRVVRGDALPFSQCRLRALQKIENVTCRWGRSNLVRADFPNGLSKF
jgi:molecular chaperone DnaK